MHCCPGLSVLNPQGLRQLSESFGRPWVTRGWLWQWKLCGPGRADRPGLHPAHEWGAVWLPAPHSSYSFRNLRNPPGPRASLEWWFGNRKVPFRDPRWGCRLGDGVRARPGFAGKNVPRGCPYPALHPASCPRRPMLSLWAQGPLRGYELRVRPS